MASPHKAPGGKTDSAIASNPTRSALSEHQAHKHQTITSDQHARSGDEKQARFHGDDVLTQLEQLRAELQAVKQNSRSAQNTTPLAQSQVDPERTLLRKGWRIIIFLVTALNVLLWISLVFAIQYVDYSRGHRHQYLTYTWLIFVLPLIILALFSFSPFPRYLPRARSRLVAHEPSGNAVQTVNTLNALFCFLFVALYIYLAAVPQFNAAQWTTSVDFIEDPPLPAIAMIPYDIDRNDNLTPQAAFGEDQYMTANYTSWNFTNDFTSMRMDAGSFSYVYTWLGWAYIYNSSYLQPRFVSSMDDELSTWMYLSYNSSEASFNATRQGLNDAANQYMYYILFDPGIDLNTWLDCSLVVYKAAPLFAYSHITTEVSYIVDQYDLLKYHFTNDTSGCDEVYRNALQHSDPPLQQYSWTLDASRNVNHNASFYCDRSLYEDASCVSQLFIRYRNQLAQTFQSQPGISKLDIWLGAASITGAVQFFTWFLALLVT